MLRELRYRCVCFTKSNLLAWIAHASCFLTSHAQILVLADPQILNGMPHPSYSKLAVPLIPLLRTFTDRFLQRVWRALRRPGGNGPAKDWTATVWLGDLTDMGRLYYVQDDLPGLYDRFDRLFPTNGGDRANRTFYTAGNHDVTLDPPPTWQPPRGKERYWELQTREYTRWKFKELFGTQVYDFGWDADAISPPLASMSQRVLRPGEEQKSRYSTKVEHTKRHSMHARVPLNVTLPDGSGPTTVAELILLDTTDVISLQRQGRDPFAADPSPPGRPGSEADWRFGGAWWFLDSLAKTQDRGLPRILFTHVPLWRDPNDETSCDLPPGGNSAESGSSSSTAGARNLPPGVQPVEPANIRRVSSAPRIVPGTNAEGTYENLVGEQWSRFILEKVQPSVVFTADDHDVCHHLHKGVKGGTGGSSVDVPELTVPALSLTSGVKRPGFARLSMWQDQQPPLGGGGVAPLHSRTRIEYLACELPPQLMTWAFWYPLIVAGAAVCLFLRRAALLRRARRAGSAGGGLSGLARSAKSALQEAAAPTSGSGRYRDDEAERDVESLPLTTLGSRSTGGSHRKETDEKDGTSDSSDLLSSEDNYSDDSVFEDDEDENPLRAADAEDVVFEYRDEVGNGHRRSQSRGGVGHSAEASGSSGSGSGSGSSSRGHSRRASRASNNNNNAIFVLDDEDVEQGAPSSHRQDSGKAPRSRSRSRGPSRSAHASELEKERRDLKDKDSRSPAQRSKRRRRRRRQGQQPLHRHSITLAPWWSPTAWLVAPVRRRLRPLWRRNRKAATSSTTEAEEILAAPPPAFIVDLAIVAWPPALFWLLLWLLGF